MATAILSITAKTEARKKGKKEDENDKMEIVKEKDAKEALPETVENKDDSAKKELKESDEVEGDKKESDKKKEPSSTSLTNPARYFPIDLVDIIRMVSSHIIQLVQDCSSPEEIRNNQGWFQVIAFSFVFVRTFRDLT